jgi:acetylglutamate kinase
MSRVSHRPQTVVLKIGGAVARIEGALLGLPALLQQASRVALVHGGGQDVSRWMERLQLPVRFKNGLRVTDADGLAVATMVLRGAVSASLAMALNGIGVRAVGLSGVDGGLLQAVPHDDPELGFVGKAGVARVALLDALFTTGFVPLIAPLAVDADGQLRNLNADTVCGALAGALAADLVIFLTDVPGVLDAQGNVIRQLSATAIAPLIAEGQIRGGMIPKVEACLAALQAGAGSVCIADGRRADLLLAYAQNNEIPGTLIIS